jgi:hypothetical protein
MVSKPIKLSHWSLFQVLRLVTLVSFDLIKSKLCFVGMNVVMGWKTITKTPTTWSQLNVVVWPNFPSKRLYTWPNVEIIFYHQTHIQANGNLTHDACDLGSTSRMSMYTSRMFHKLKEFICTQLHLGYIVKNIYDKHKKIWRAWANVGE